MRVGPADPRLLDELGHAATASAQFVVVGLGGPAQPLRLTREAMVGWREATHARHLAQHGAGAVGREHAAATMVLAWALDALAQPIAHTALTRGVVPAPSSPAGDEHDDPDDPDDPDLVAATSLALAPGAWFPTHVTLGWRGITASSDPVETARRTYVGPATALATAYDAGVRMSSRQRRGLVDDVWRVQLARGRRQPPPARAACCMLVALPGMSPCAGCPQQVSPAAR